MRIRITLGPFCLLQIMSEETEQTYLATFSLEQAPRYEDGDDVVYPNALIFEAGEYPDKKLTVTPEELAQMAAEYEPLYGDLEHFLDKEQDPGMLRALEKKLGHMPRVWVDPNDPTKLRGEIRIPKWLNDSVLALGKGISSVIPLDGSKKRLSRYTLTTRPRVSAAALFSDYAAFAGSRHSQSDLKEIQQIHDLAANQGATCQAPDTRAKMSAPVTDTKKEKPKMSLGERLAAIFSRPEIQAELDDYKGDSGDENDNPVTTTPTPTVASAEPTEREKALMSQLAEVKAQQAEAEKKAREDKVKAEVEALIKSGQIAPASEETAVKALLSSMEDDAAKPRVITFSDNTERSRHDTLLSFMQSLPASVPLGEHQSAQVILSVSDTGEKPPTEAEKQARLQELLATTDLGRSALKSANGNGK